MTLPSGWTVRPVELIDGDGPDVARAFAVIAAHEEALGHPTETTIDTVRSDLTAPDCDLAHCLLVLDDQGTPRGHLWLAVDPLAREVFLDAYAEPGFDLLPLLIDRALERAGEVAVEHGGAWTLRGGHFAEDAASDTALTEAGFSVTRHFLRMRIDLDASPVVEPPPWSAGVTCEVLDSPQDRREWHEVLQDAFADHWNHTPHPFEDEWIVLSTPPEHHDPLLWWLVRVDGEPAAMLIGSLSRAHLGDGYVRMLGVRRPYRGRGIARTLLLRHFADSRERGFHGVQLGVDGESPTGAVALYESVGMRPVRHITARERSATGP